MHTTAVCWANICWAAIIGSPQALPQVFLQLWAKPMGPCASWGSCLAEGEMPVTHHPQAHPPQGQRRAEEARGARGCVYEADLAGAAGTSCRMEEGASDPRSGGWSEVKWGRKKERGEKKPQTTKWVYNMTPTLKKMKKRTCGYVWKRPVRNMPVSHGRHKGLWLISHFFGFEEIVSF